MSTSTALRNPLASAADDVATAMAALCKAAADPLRLLVLRLLARDSFGVLELTQMFDCGQSGMSHHLKVLARAGLVDKRREGNSIFYRRAERAAQPALDELQRALFDSADRLEIPGAVAQQLAVVQHQREQRSRQFFADNAGAFRSQQELIAAFEVYAPQVASHLDASFPEGNGTALEVGPGDGSFLPELAQRFRRVVALDNAASMLARARALVDSRGLDNVELLLGDTGDQRLREQDIDCVVMNMVLHHVPEPALIFSDIARLLRPGGRLLVTELCRHDQAWAREACGDVWLGFEPEALGGWATAAGLIEETSVYLAQRNGFRIQVREFVKTRDAVTPHAEY